jgi:hypothetical protein
MASSHDKCTVVSIVPFPIVEAKPGLYPGYFRIHAAKADDFEFIVVERSVHHVYLDSDRGSLTVQVPSDEVARSIAEDYARAQLAYTQGIAEPGIFWIPGEYTDKKAIVAIAKDKLAQVREMQKNWFMRLVAIADDEWNKYHSHKSISDLQRFAAKSLGLDREWNIQGAVANTKFCPACKTPTNVGAIVCSNCRTIIDHKAYKEAGFVQAGA